MTDRDAFKILSLQPKEWPAAVEKLSGVERDDLARRLADFAQSAAWLSAYAEQRHGCGCGDQGHGDAVDSAKRAQAGVREALGFTYPNRGVLSL